MSTASVAAAAVVAAMCGVPSTASAQTIDVARFFAGAAVGLGIHESAHLIADEAYGANPGVRKVSAGFIPFFAITHEPVTPVKEFTISSAGFWAQEVGSEVLLSRRPNLHDGVPDDRQRRYRLRKERAQQRNFDRGQPR